MIRYDLRCSNGHDFDGWFRSSDGFETMRDAGLVECAECGDTQVRKALMAPRVSERRGTEKTAPGTHALEKLRRHVEANSDYVGPRFAEEARAMHEGRAPGRAIHGEARPEEARKLVDEGIPVAPLPFLPRQKTN
ncbi:DUF1178 family protein [Paracoccus sp. 1_MG-2023]|uniref:DUF1178 family protein n=1 Tax=unclassified Paracoccus (in: a-proteobacteria) TaxID=2688777 RepID=UPI001C08EE03|nr:MULTISPECIES: DUF1178 family protein [unclassified Paracoccus (in: a-proteobacteria)]MBU2959215.1 DUF1178 family protein [Paracoccus sp. C2R09]MDO6670325.1 DUF1178 family protein [Paracoccus sp. 1_MG-2023]